MRSSAIAFAVLMGLGACGGGSTTAAQPGAQDTGHGSHSDAGSSVYGSIGYPGDPSTARRRIRITALDSARFEPSRIVVRQGETITFFVTNLGQTVHEFVMGDLEYQQGHAGEMAADPEHHESPNSVSLEPGETLTLTWTFTTPGKIFFACHEADHYEAGMQGTIIVKEA